MTALQPPLRKRVSLAEDPAAPPNGIDPWSPFIAGMQAWTRQMVHASSTLQREWFTFLDKRMKEDVAFTQELADCKAPDQVARVYSTFMQTAIEDYQKEFAALTQLGTTIAGNGFAPLQSAENGAAQHESSNAARG